MYPIYLFRRLTWPFRYFFSQVKRKLGKLGLLRLEVFIVLGNNKQLFVKGRVTEAYRQSRPSDKKTTLQNILGTIRRYAGSSVPGAQVMLEIGGQNKILTADDEGIFAVLLDLIGDRPKSVNEVRLSLLPEEGIKPEKKFINKKVLSFQKSLPRAIISDIDDTIIISKATNIQEKFWLSISKNAYTRRPFPGVSDFYRLLSANGACPVFYVSSSDWNLFDLIKDFISYREIPEGPIFLKDQHMDLKNIWKSGGGSHDHKLEKISFLMNFFPKLNFVLIGDSGQHDPEIYGEIIDKFSNRIEAVFIRQVGEKNPAREKMLNTRLPENKVFWVKNSDEAIAHAKAHLVDD